MPNAGAPPFQYSKRGGMMSRLDGQMLAAVTEDRDRELEDFLAWLKENSGGSGPPPVGADEVFIGPNDPGGAYELWYDTDAVAPVTTLGVVGRRYAIGSAFSTTGAAVGQDITVSSGQAPAISVALSATRLYRFQFNASAMCQGAVGDRLLLELVGSSVLREFKWGVQAINQGYTINAEWLYYPADSGVVRNYRVRARHQGTGPFVFNTTNASDSMDFMIEDIGAAM